MPRFCLSSLDHVVKFWHWSLPKCLWFIPSIALAHTSYICVKQKCIGTSWGGEQSPHLKLLAISWSGLTGLLLTNKNKSVAVRSTLVRVVRRHIDVFSVAEVANRYKGLVLLVLACEEIICEDSACKEQKCLDCDARDSHGSRGSAESLDTAEN